MSSPWKHPKTGIYYFRKRVPEDLRPVIGKLEIKRSLQTKNPSEARLAFLKAATQYEALLDNARKQLQGTPTLTPAAASDLANKWAAKEIQRWHSNPDGISEFLAHVGDEVLPAIDALVLIEDAPNSLQTKEKVVLEYVTDTLREEYLPIPDRDTLTYKTLIESFFARWRELSEIAHKRSNGDWNSRIDLPNPVSVKPARESISEAPTLTEVFKLWAKDKADTDGNHRGTNKTIAEFQTTAERFVSIFGDMNVDRISRSKVLEFKSTLSNLPARPTKAMKAMPLAQQIDTTQQKQLETLSLATVRKQLKALSALLNFARQRLGAIQEDPVSASGILKQISKAIKRNSTVFEDEKSYSWEELKKIFSGPAHTEGWKPPRADFGEAFYWLPLLMAYTGCRREEAAQLLVSDVQNDTGTNIWFISIRPGEGQIIKSSSSKRRVPLHRDLLALGFIEYVQAQAVSGRLFPKLQDTNSEGFGYNFGKRWAVYLRDVVKLGSTANPSHGFRHTFKTLCREVGIPEEVHDWVTGHAPSNVGATYGSNPLTRMARELEKFPSIAAAAGLLPELVELNGHQRDSSFASG